MKGDGFALLVTPPSRRKSSRPRGIRFAGFNFLDGDYNVGVGYGHSGGEKSPEAAWRASTHGLAAGNITLHRGTLPARPACGAA
jgi:hypothetical protein